MSVLKQVTPAPAAGLGMQRASMHEAWCYYAEYTSIKPNLGLARVA